MKRELSPAWCRIWMLALLFVCFVCFVVPAPAADWVHWRGPTQNGVSPEKGLPDKWSTDPNASDSNLVWTRPYGCRSTPLVMDGKVYIINLTGQGLTEQERV